MRYEYFLPFVGLLLVIAGALDGGWAWLVVWSGFNQRTTDMCNPQRDPMITRINRDQVEARGRSQHLTSAKMPLSPSRPTATWFRNAPLPFIYFDCPTSAAFLF
jgi:hypothetical protein